VSSARGESSSGEAEEVGMLCIQLEKRFEEEDVEEAKGKARGRGKKDASDDSSDSASDSGGSWETASVACECFQCCSPQASSLKQQGPS